MRALKTFSLFSLIFLSFPIFAQTRQEAERPWWFVLDEGISLFRAGSYGNALMAFEDARRGRLAQFERMERNFILLLSAPEVRRLGDSLELVERHIAENRQTDAAAALDELYYRVPRESLDGSAARALEEMGRLKRYPEAEFWLGETYLAEGELPLAFRQYEKAWEARDLLEIPGFDAEILYRITDIHRLRGEYQDMERRANEIIEGAGPSGAPRDEFWTGAAQNSQNSGNRIRAAMTRVLENEGVNRFLVLYRYRNAVTERAHRLMGFFCYASNRYAMAAEHLMFSFLIQNTALIDEAIRRQFDFAFTSLEDLMAFAGTRPEFAAYLEETEYFRTVFYLASALFATGKTRPAGQLWAFLAGSEGAGEWGARARASRSPVIDRQPVFNGR